MSETTDHTATAYDDLRDRVVAFAGQLQAWGYDDAARNMLEEVLEGNVNAPDFYELRSRVAELEAENESLARTAVTTLDELSDAAGLDQLWQQLTPDERNGVRAKLTSGLVPTLAVMLRLLLTKEDGTLWNHVQWDLATAPEATAPEFTLTLQRIDGTTPAQRVGQARALMGEVIASSANALPTELLGRIVSFVEATGSTY